MPADRVLLAFEDARLAGELPDRFVDAGGLHDAALLGEVAVEHGQAAVLRVGVRLVADAARLAIEVEAVVAAVLAERLLGGHATGRRRE